MGLFGRGNRNSMHVVEGSQGASNNAVEAHVRQIARALLRGESLQEKYFSEEHSNVLMEYNRLKADGLDPAIRNAVKIHELNSHLKNPIPSIEVLTKRTGPSRDKVLEEMKPYVGALRRNLETVKKYEVRMLSELSKLEGKMSHERRFDHMLKLIRRKDRELTGEEKDILKAMTRKHRSVLASEREKLEEAKSNLKGLVKGTDSMLSSFKTTEMVDRLKDYETNVNQIVGSLNRYILLLNDMDYTIIKKVRAMFGRLTNAA